MSLSPTPLPIKQMTCVVLVQICEAMNVNVLFPFLAFMVEDMGYTNSELGYYAGGLAAAFCGAQFCSSILWGVISDKYGRKSAIVLGTIGVGLGMAIFGTAKTYTQAVLGRFIGGFLCGNLGVLKSFLTEITDDSNRGKGFSYISVAWSIGTILAPLAGGLLSNPVDKYPQLFHKKGIFDYYPYLLPCLLCFIFNIFTAFYCLLFMRETRFKNNPSTNSSNINNSNSNSPRGFGLELISPKKNKNDFYSALPVSINDDDDLFDGSGPGQGMKGDINDEISSEGEDDGYNNDNEEDDQKKKNIKINNNNKNDTKNDNKNNSKNNRKNNNLNENDKKKSGKVAKNVMGCISFTAVTIQINHSVYEENLGIANGLGQSLASLARSIGPAFGGALWSLSVKSHFVYCNFIAVIIIFLINIYVNSLLPKGLDNKKKRKDLIDPREYHKYRDYFHEEYSNMSNNNSNNYDNNNNNNENFEMIENENDDNFERIGEHV
eukprot:gene8496-11485_t